jgi:hypothetical protein
MGKGQREGRLEKKLVRASLFTNVSSMALRHAKLLNKLLIIRNWKQYP